MISIFTLTYNESLLMQFMIDHYRSRFPNCNFTIYDNNSTDNTVDICKSNGCKVLKYDSNNTLNDFLHIEIKNNCWKNAETDWVLVSDLDELLNINEDQLMEEENKKTTIIKAECWQMVNIYDNCDIHGMKYGYRHPEDSNYDKSMLFNKKYIKEINYSVGCHFCHPIGTIKYGKQYKMYHYKFINPDIEVLKKQETAKRLSKENKRNGCGLQCIMSKEDIIKDFNGRRNVSGLTKLRE